IVRPTVQDHLDNLKLDNTLINPKPKAIVIFDDVITTGASFKAAKEILNTSFPKIPSIGIFIARNIPNQNLLSNLNSKN
ncbi:MAG: hypothetical protein PSV35_05800, partial [bacterium]|nr:hypothetical protein [bacterium]